MPNPLGPILGSAFSDIAFAFGSAASNLVGSLAGEALGRLMTARAEVARSILLSEIKHGLRLPRDPGEVDEFVAILYRYLRAADEGAARLNLRLMARVIRSQIEGNGLYASDFLRHAEMLASLSREEVILLAARLRAARSVSSGLTLSSAHNAQVEKELVPAVFPTRLDLIAALTALQRTGLIWPSMSTTAGGPVWDHTPLIYQIADLAQFESVLETENVGAKS